MGARTGRGADTPAPPAHGLARWREVLDFLLPSRCLGCDDRLPPERTAELVCPSCVARLREPPWPRCPRCHFPAGTGRVSDHCLACQGWSAALRSARAAVILEDPAERLVHALKYEGWRELAPLLARRMQSAAPAHDADSLVVPVPTTARRQRQRGYNQAELIARAFAEQRGLECRPALLRASGGGSQVALHPSERRSNVRGAFVADDAHVAALANRDVLLVDDVLTTGATAAEAAAALERAGARGVSLVTFARALPELRRSR